MSAIAAFISSHGFGHAARASAILTALHEKRPDIRVEIFTGAPRWFFQASLAFPFGYHPTVSDIGLVQNAPLTEDLPATVERLGQFIPFPAMQLNSLAYALQRLDCRIALCDISPVGIAAAKTAGIPSVLVENFTWDWIYQGYLSAEPGLEPFLAPMREVFSSATHHLQARPFCERWGNAEILEPVSRTPRASREETRARLGIPADAPAILLTMGGIPAPFHYLDTLTRLEHLTFIVPGGSEQQEQRKNLVLLPHRSGFYHPDLMFAVDAVVAKVGYSTLAEAYHAGIPFAFVTRQRFRESGVLADFIRQELAGFEIPETRLETGDWVDQLPALLEAPRRTRPAVNGAGQAADAIIAVPHTC